MGTDKLEEVLVRMPAPKTRRRTRGLQRRRLMADTAHEQVFISKFNLT
jgi:hypothetical protein